LPRFHRSDGGARRQDATPFRLRRRAARRRPSLVRQNIAGVRERAGRRCAFRARPRPLYSRGIGFAPEMVASSAIMPRSQISCNEKSATEREFDLSGKSPA